MIPLRTMLGGAALAALLAFGGAGLAQGGDKKPGAAAPAQGGDKKAAPVVPAPAADPKKAEVLPAHAAGGRDAALQLEAAQREFGLPALKDWGKIRDFLYVIGGAIAIGTLLALHPFVSRKTSLEELDQPKIIITYTVVGALVAIVVSHIPEMGFAIFGIGALMRFRTELGAAKETGRVILATVLGIACGLGFWMVAIVGTVIALAVISVLEYRKSMRMVVRGVAAEAVSEAAEAYAGVLQALKCRFATPRKNPGKGQVSFVLRVGRSLDREEIETQCQAGVPEELRGTIDWPED